MTLYDQEKELMRTQLDKFKSRNGIVPENGDTKLFEGFVSRGQPLRFLKRLAAQLHEMRQEIRAEYLASGNKQAVESVEGAVPPLANAEPDAELPLFEDEPTALFEDDDWQA